MAEKLEEFKNNKEDISSQLDKNNIKRVNLVYAPLTLVGALFAEKLNKKNESNKKNNDVKYIFEPLNEYNSHLKNEFKNNAEQYFESLCDKVNLNRGENIQTYKEYNETNKKINSLNNCISNNNSRKNLIKGLSVFGIIIGIILIFIGAVNIHNIALAASTIVIGSLLIIGLIFVLIKFWNYKKDENILFEKEKRKLEEKVKELVSTLTLQMSSLNNSYSSHMFKDIYSSVIKGCSFDRYLDYKKFSLLKDKYELLDNFGDDESMVCVLSGELYGSPFVMYDTVYKEMGTKTYSNSIVVTYTVGSGKDRHTHSETLTAYVTKPCPYYYTRNTLFYGNEACPNLKFVRKPTHINKPYTEKELRNKSKDLLEQVDKKMMEGSNQLLMSNTDFEVYFSCLNRNNEVEYRTLFTSLAQNNLIDLITSNPLYGDDFLFIKDGVKNYIKSSHSQVFDFDKDTNNFVSLSYELSKELFVSYSVDFSNNLFFDMAPILSIPLYSQHKPLEYIYKDYYERNYSTSALEPLINKCPQSYFMPRLGKTTPILKISPVDKVDEYDISNVYAYSYNTIEMVENVSVHCSGNGRNYIIPVTWIKYVPVSKVTQVLVTDLSKNEDETKSILDLIKNKKDVNDPILNRVNLSSMVTSNSLTLFTLKYPKQNSKVKNSEIEVVNNESKVKTKENQIRQKDLVLSHDEYKSIVYKLKSTLNNKDS